MEAATVFALAAKRGVKAACVLIATDLLRPTRTRIAPEPLLHAERRLGECAARALGAGV
jgi:hypothetical protein